MYTFSDDAMKELNFVLNAFKSACHCIDSRPKTTETTSTDYDTESMVSPMNFYHVQFRDKYAHIEKRRNLYYIRCHNFKPSFLEPVSLDKFDFDLYGGYVSVDECIQKFAKLLSEFVSYQQPVLIF